MSAAVEQKIITILAQVMNMSPEQIDSTSSPDTIGVWDSLKHMNLVMAIEEEFDMQFSEDQIMAELLSVRQIVDAIAAHEI
jgi:acyl carrier protein